MGQIAPKSVSEVPWTTCVAGADSGPWLVIAPLQGNAVVAQRIRSLDVATRIAQLHNDALDLAEDTDPEVCPLCNHWRHDGRLCSHRDGFMACACTGARPL